MVKSASTHDHSDTKTKILAAAASRFREKGYAAVSLREIAKTAGLTTGSLYYYYRSKDEVVEEILTRGHTNIRQAIETEFLNIPIAPTSEKIRLAIKTHIQCLFGDDSLPSANIRIFSQVPAEIVSASMASRRDYEMLWSDLLVRAKSEGLIAPELDTNVMVPILFGAMNWTIEWFDEGVHDLDQVIEQIMLMLT